MTKHLTLCCVVATFFTQALSARPAVADVNDAVQVELTALAKDIETFLVKKRFTVISVGAFDGPGKIGGGAGPEVQLKLARSMEALGFKIDPMKYEVEIKGHYSAFNDENNHLAVRVTATLHDEFGTALVEFTGLSRNIYGTESVPRLLGIASATKPDADYSSRSEEWKSNYRNPKTAANGTIIRNSADSPYAVEILVKTGSAYVPRPIDATKSADGKAYVPLLKGDIYAVRLINDSKLEAAVNLTIDGISNFAFSTDNPQSSYWIVPPGKSILVRGWSINNKTSIEFKTVDQFSDTAAAKLNLKPHAGIGIISAAFSAAWSGDNKPDDERNDRGTGFGKEIGDDTIIVRRTIGQTRELVHVRYER